MELIARLAIEVDHSLVHAVAFSEEVEGDIGRDQPAANQEHDLTTSVSATAFNPPYIE